MYNYEWAKPYSIPLFSWSLKNHWVYWYQFRTNSNHLHHLLIHNIYLLYPSSRGILFAFNFDHNLFWGWKTFTLGQHLCVLIFYTAHSIQVTQKNYYWEKTVHISAYRVQFAKAVIRWHYFLFLDPKINVSIS